MTQNVDIIKIYNLRHFYPVSGQCPRHFWMYITNISNKCSLEWDTITLCTVSLHNYCLGENGRHKYCTGLQPREFLLLPGTCPRVPNIIFKFPWIWTHF